MKKNLAFTAAAFLIFCLVLELGLRAYFGILDRVKPAPLRFEERLGWTTPAFVKSLSRPKGFDELIVTSTVRDGFRAFGNPASTKRKMWVIGDSFTQAAAASNGQAYYERIAKAADIELFAYGCGGYGTLQEHLILDRYLDEIKPDFVLWQFSGNDLINNDYEIESRSRINNNRNVRPYWRGGRIEWLYPKEVGAFPAVLTRYSYLVRLTAVMWNKLRPGSETIEDKLVAGNPLLARSEETTVEILQMVRKRCGKIPVVAFLADESRSIGDENFERVCSAAGIGYIRGVPGVIRAAKQKGFKVDGSPYDSHWNRVGHQIAGEYLLNALRHGGPLDQQKGQD